MTVQMLRDAGAEVEAGTQHLAAGSPGADGGLPDTWVVRPWGHRQQHNIRSA